MVMAVIIPVAMPPMMMTMVPVVGMSSNGADRTEGAPDDRDRNQGAP
jgi:hypothetical protein